MEGGALQPARFELFDFDIYVICGDGDLMEGVSHEAASFAGHQRLDNLCWIYDNNHITIDGRTEITYSDDVAKRFEAYGWNVTGSATPTTSTQIDPRLRTLQGDEDRPTLIIVDSHIGYGSPHKQDTAAAHGEPLGEEEVRETKRSYGWPEDAQFLVPDGVIEHFADGRRRPRRRSCARRGSKLLVSYEREHESLERRSARCSAASCPRAGTATSPSFEPDQKGIATRKASNRCRTRSPSRCPGCSAARPTSPTRPRRASTMRQRRRLRARRPRRAQPPLRHPRARGGGGRQRALALEAAPVVVDVPRVLRLRRPAMRLSALMELPVIHMFTHDSIGLGEDGPTHQPVEQLASLRAIPA